MIQNRNYLLVFIFTIVLFSCKNQTRNQTSSLDDEFIADSLTDMILVGEPFTNERENNFDYEQLELIAVDLNNDDIVDTIILEKIKGWTDPGDFHRALISITKGKSLTLFNIDGWTTTDYIAEYVSDFNESSQVRSKYLTIKHISDDNSLIFFKGYHYASHPGLLTIVDILDGEKPVLVFNKEVGIYAFDDFNDDNSIDLATVNVYKEYFDQELDSIYVYIFKKGFIYDKELSIELFNK